MDWTQSKVLFISPQFTTYQRQSIEFKDLPFELWEIRKYSNNTIVMNQHRSTSQESVHTIMPTDDRLDQVKKEIIIYTEDYHLEKGSPATIELYQEIKARVLDMGEFDMNPTKFYIGFKLHKKVVTDIELQKKQLRMRINLKKGQLEDPNQMFEDVSEKGHWGLGDYEAKINTDPDVDYLMSMIRQSFKYYSEG